LLNARFAAAWAKLKGFSYARGEWARLVDQTFHGLTVQPPSRTFFPELYEDFTQASTWHVFEDVLPTLRELAAQGLKLGIISNWDERLRPLLGLLKLHDYFDAIAISCEVGFAKPLRVIFEKAAKELGVPAETILHVGDSRVEDLHGALEAGCRALVLRRGTSAANSDEISTLRELPSRAEALSNPD